MIYFEKKNHIKPNERHLTALFQSTNTMFSVESALEASHIECLGKPEEMY